MLRNTRYLDYDPDVFRQLVSFYVNGLALTDADKVDVHSTTAAASQQL